MAYDRSGRKSADRPGRIAYQHLDIDLVCPAACLAMAEGGLAMPPIISDREIWACAATILRRYDDAAAFHAGQRADELIAASDIEGQRSWLRILARINELERIEPCKDQMVQ